MWIRNELRKYGNPKVQLADSEDVNLAPEIDPEVKNKLKIADSE